jgi:preprotein translocase subunit SecG
VVTTKVFPVNTYVTLSKLLITIHYLQGIIHQMAKEVRFMSKILFVIVFMFFVLTLGFGLVRAQTATPEPTATPAGAPRTGHGTMAR